MLREVSDLSIGSHSDDEGFDTSDSLTQLAAYQTPAANFSLWKSRDNPLVTLPDEPQRADSGDQDDTSAQSGGFAELDTYKGQVRFNTAFERDEVSIKQEDADALPASWSACDNDDLGQVAALLAAASSFTAELAPKQNKTVGSQAEIAPSEANLEADDMLGMGIVDLRTCTLVRQTPASDWSQQVHTSTSFNVALKVNTMT